MEKNFFRTLSYFVISQLFKGKISTKSRAASSFLSQRLDQSFILEKIFSWVNYKKYDSRYLEIIGPSSPGLCSGFTTAWLYYAIRGKLNYYYDLLKAVSDWKEGDDTKDSQFDELCNMLFWFHAPQIASRHVFPSSIRKKINFLIPKTSSHHVSLEFQFSFLFTENELEQFLEKIKNKLKEKMLFIAIEEHHVGFCVGKDNIMRFYDPNAPGGAVEIKSMRDLKNKIVGHSLKVLELNDDAISNDLVTAKGHYFPVSINIFNLGRKDAVYGPLNAYFPPEFERMVNRKNEGDPSTALYLACFHKQKAMIKLLLESHADPNEGMWIAAAKGDVRLLKLLLQKGADVNKLNHENHTPLFYAAAFGQTEAVEFLISRRSRCGIDQVTPLMIASQNGYLAIVIKLIDAGAVVSARVPDDGMQAIHYAALNGHPAIVTHLIRHDADKNALTSRKESPLYFAILANKRSVVSQLAGDHSSLAGILLAAVETKNVSLLQCIDENFKDVFSEFLDPDQEKKSSSLVFFMGRTRAYIDLRTRVRALLSEKLSAVEDRQIQSKISLP